MNSYSENPVTCNFLFSRIHKKVHIWSFQAAERWVGFNFSWSRGVVEALPFLAYTGMCHWTGYGFKGLESSTGYGFKGLESSTGYTISLLSIFTIEHQGQKVESPVLNRVAKWAIFVLNRVRVWSPQQHTSS